MSSLYPDPIMKCHKIIGYNGKNTLNMLWLDNKHIVYASHTVIVESNIETGEQSFFFGHTGDVKCLSIDSEAQMLASSQDVKTPLIRLWDTKTKECISVIQGHKKEISSIAISDQAKFLVAVGKDKKMKELIIVWDISSINTTGTVQTVAKYSCNYSINKIQFVPFQETKLVSCGLQSIRFWRIKGKSLRGCSLVNENYELTRQNFLDLSFERNFIGLGSQSQNRFFVSTQSGSVYEIN
jgi:WD40 repeat protein